MRQLDDQRDDAVSDVLTQMQVHSSVYCLAELRSPWGFRVVGRDVAKFHLLLDGHAWLVLDHWEPLRVSSGDLVILPHGSAHAMKDQPESKVEALDRVLQGNPLDQAARLHYGGKGAETRMLCGGFGLRDSAPQVLARLPEVLTIDARGGPVGSWTEAVFTLLQQETAQSLPGAKAILAKIADVFLAQAVRAFLTNLPDRADPSVAALADPQVAEAVRLMQVQPEVGWTVGQLAYRVGMSRSSFSDRFRELVGEPPMRHLIRSRLTQAAAHLATSNRTVHEIAKLCGYQSDAALAKAFKREYHLTPGEYRVTAARRPIIDIT